MSLFKRYYPVLVAVLVAVLPLGMNTYWTEVAVNVGLYALLALSLNVILGQAGIFHMGHAAFYAVGAYVTAILNTHYQIPILLLIPVAGAAAALGGPAALEGAPGQAAAAPGAGRRRALGVGGVPVRRLGASWGTDDGRHGTLPASCSVGGPWGTDAAWAEGAADTDPGGGREGRRGAMSAAGPGRRRAHRKNTSICRATCTDTR